MGEFELKPMNADAVDSALDKASWYRSLNEPQEAESICRDVLALEPDHQKAIVTLLLALSDQFPQHLAPSFREAKALIDQLDGEYERAYYGGLLAERRAKCLYHRSTPGRGHLAYEGLREAMAFYEVAEKKRPSGNDDAVLRWNACARMIDSKGDIAPSPEPSRGMVELE